MVGLTRESVQEDAESWDGYLKYTGEENNKYFMSAITDAKACARYQGWDDVWCHLPTDWILPSLPRATFGKGVVMAGGC